VHRSPLLRTYVRHATRGSMVQQARIDDQRDRSMFISRAAAHGPAHRAGPPAAAAHVRTTRHPAGRSRSMQVPRSRSEHGSGEFLQKAGRSAALCPLGASRLLTRSFAAAAIAAPCLDRSSRWGSRV
jgi:hypothetical protein